MGGSVYSEILTIAQGEYSNAYINFLDAESISFIILDLGLNLSSVAEKNLSAALGQPSRDRSKKPGFEDFMKTYLPGLAA